MFMENTFDKKNLNVEDCMKHVGFSIGNFSSEGQGVQTQGRDQAVSNERKTTVCKSQTLSRASPICFDEVIRCASRRFCVLRYSPKL